MTKGPGPFLAFALGIQVRISKNDLNMEALSIGLINIHWSQCFNQILTNRLNHNRPGHCGAGCTGLTTTTGPVVIKPLDEIKIWLKHCDPCDYFWSLLSGSWVPPYLNSSLNFRLGFLICINIPTFLKNIKLSWKEA